MNIVCTGKIYRTTIFSTRATTFDSCVEFISNICKRGKERENERDAEIQKDNEVMQKRENRFEVSRNLDSYACWKMIMRTNSYAY